MGDRVSIPRSFSGLIGVADTEESVRRHYFPVPLIHPKNNTTTGPMFGGDSNTTGAPFFQRNAIFERVLVTGFMRTTVNSSTTLLTLNVMGNGVSTIFSITLRNSTTQPERWMAASTSPVAVPVSMVERDTRLSVRLVTRNQMSLLSCILVFRERLDT